MLGFGPGLRVSSVMGGEATSYTFTVTGLRTDATEGVNTEVERTARRTHGRAGRRAHPWAFALRCLDSPHGARRLGGSRFPCIRTTTL
ncbi:hypothetical protein SUDANB106_00777 [Streptomyces sp. enrichment culture]